ncbi:NADPH-dependent diflavin oxidoreductase 1 [Thoreauomyces humboldtii]|nr:NADPH-dependent diflavin oxidoreductase 1 [Thoreauomyces humboldtii]
MDEYDRSQLIDEPLVIFICSTTGQGSEPTTMTRFWHFLLRKSHPRDILSHMHVAVFGLGDSSYPKFNFPAKKLHKRLVAGLGAQAVLERGDGDDQHYLGVDGALDPWMEELWAKLSILWPLPAGKDIISADIVPTPTYDLIFDNGSIDADGDLMDGLSFEALDLQKTAPSVKTIARAVATVQCNQRLTAPDHSQDVRHFELAVDGSQPYIAGDVMVIYPQNLPDDIALVLAHFGWAEIADLPFMLRPTAAGISAPASLPAHVTLRYLFTHYLDIFGRPRRYFFHLLSFFTTDPLHASKLRELSSPQGQSELYSYSHRPRRTMFEILQDFHSAKVPLKYLLDLIPAIRPRNFSIASSPVAHPGQIHLCIAIVEYTTKMKAPRTGVCTKWMKHLRPGDTVAYAIKRGTLKLPVVGDHRPVIMCGPGTGVAPMRAFLHDRAATRCGSDTLFVGARFRDKDYLYADEWAGLENQGRLKLFTAFSRDQDDKIYVQHRILENSAHIYATLVEQNGVFLLSGNASRMPVDVTDALAECVVKEGHVSREAAETTVKLWEKEGRFQMECWS